MADAPLWSVRGPLPLIVMLLLVPKSISLTVIAWLTLAVVLPVITPTNWAMSPLALGKAPVPVTRVQLPGSVQLVELAPVHWKVDRRVRSSSGSTPGRGAKGRRRCRYWRRVGP